jgi:hypothetical protein
MNRSSVTKYIQSSLMAAGLMLSGVLSVSAQTAPAAPAAPAMAATLRQQLLLTAPRQARLAFKAPTSFQLPQMPIPIQSTQTKTMVSVARFSLATTHLCGVKLAQV